MHWQLLIIFTFFPAVCLRAPSPTTQMTLFLTLPPISEILDALLLFTWKSTCQFVNWNNFSKLLWQNSYYLSIKYCIKLQLTCIWRDSSWPYHWWPCPYGITWPGHLVQTGSACKYSATRSWLMPFLLRSFEDKSPRRSLFRLPFENIDKYQTPSWTINRQQIRPCCTENTSAV
jgi:hypothetical protein